MPEGLGGLGGLIWDMSEMAANEDEQALKAFRNLAISRLVKKTLLETHGDLNRQKGSMQQHLPNDATVLWKTRVQRSRNLKPDLGTLWKTRVG